MSRKSIAATAVKGILKRKRVHKMVMPPELVEWDRKHGKRMFHWNNAFAANKWRTQQARELLWGLQVVAENTKVRALYNLTAKHNGGQRGYVELSTIISDGKLPIIIQELKVRHRNLVNQYEFLGEPIKKLASYADGIFDEIINGEREKEAA